MILEADLPGATEQGLHVQLEDNVLNLYARIESPAPAGGTARSRGVSPGRLSSFVHPERRGRSRANHGRAQERRLPAAFCPRPIALRTRRIEIKSPDIADIRQRPREQTRVAIRQQPMRVLSRRLASQTQRNFAFRSDSGAAIMARSTVLEARGLQPASSVAERIQPDTGGISPAAAPWPRNPRRRSRDRIRPGPRRSTSTKRRMR